MRKIFISSIGVFVFCILVVVGLCACSFWGDEETDEKIVDCFIGEAISNSDDVTFVVNSVTNTNRIGDYYYVETEANFIVVSITITNNGDEPYSPNPNYFTVKKGNSEYEYSSATYRFDNHLTGSDEVNPGLSKSYMVAFETPTTTEDEDYSLLCGTSGLWTSAVEINLRER